MAPRIKKILTIIIATAGLGIAIGFFLIGALKYYAQTPVTQLSGQAKPSAFIITRGENFRVIARRLADAGFIDSPFRFRLFARLNGLDKQIKIGEYRLSYSQSPQKILATLIEGKVILYRLTIPEGFTLNQIAHSAANAGLTDVDSFLRTINAPEFIQSLQIDASSLEGYLFPDTYHFPRTVRPSTIIRTMVRRLRAVFTPEWKTAAGEKGLTVHQVLTLASIIEKETGDPGERALISSVFHNRLKKGMRLESDPTVIYGIPDFDGNITRKHLRTPTPYNTYLNTGLPPGPIANPGAAAIKAALFPAKTRYLFFVARKDGTHQFSTSFAAHKRAVKKYQLSRTPQ